MLQNIFETVVRGSNTIFLNIPAEDYFFAYKDINKTSAEDVVSNYFIMKSKDGIPQVKAIEHLPEIHMVKVTVDIEMDRDYKIQPYEVPHIFISGGEND